MRYNTKIVGYILVVCGIEMCVSSMASAVDANMWSIVSMYILMRPLLMQVATTKLDNRCNENLMPGLSGAFMVTAEIQTGLRSLVILENIHLFVCCI